MNLFLIPQYGAFGCCISALCSQVLLGLSTMTFVHRKLKTPIDGTSLIFYLLNGLIICAVLYGLVKVPVNTLLLIPLASLITFLVMWLGKMIPLNSWLSFLKKR